MKLAQLKNLVKKGESDSLEFKATTANLKNGMTTICAFLNSARGGSVIFGVNDKGKIVGQEVADSTRKEIAAAINRIEPYIKIEPEYVRIQDDRQVIIFTIKPGNNSPYSYDGRAYVRNQSTTGYMSKEEYLYLHNLNNQTQWESLTNNTCKLSDLDRTRIKEVVRMAIYEKRMPESAASSSIPDILKKLGLMVNEKITNAAVILFCKNEDKQFMQSHVKLARFRGIDKTEFINNKLFKGNAFDIYDKAMDFLVFSLPTAAWIEPGNPIRVEVPAIPYNVLREALTNALIHRDYSNSGGFTSIAIYDDRVNISNSGALPKGIELKQLSKEHSSILRNPLIANVFYLCGKIEKWGRGTLDMIEDCKKTGNPAPKYEEVGGTFSITLPLKEPMPTIVYDQPKKIEFGELTKRQQEIINILQKGPLKMPQIMDKISVQVLDRTLQRDLAKLKQMGLIKSEGRTKTTIWSLTN